jgi:hypothetical protein
MSYRRLLFSSLLAALLLGLPAVAAAQPFPPGPPPFGPVPFGRLSMMRAWLLDHAGVPVPPFVPGPVVVPVPGELPPGVRVTAKTAAELTRWLREQLRAEIKAERELHITLGEALLLGVDIDVRLGGSFFKLEETKENLQIALVIDGTDSMGRDIDSLKETLLAFVEQVSAGKPDGKVSFALLVYRDTDVVRQSRGRLTEVTLPLNRFTPGTEGIESALARVGVATGAPYFEELADEGLHQALTNLDWATDANTSKWIILCGDAPPYAPVHPSRRHITPELVLAARHQDIQIHSVLCRSGFVPPLPESYGWNVVETSALLRPALRVFMAELALGTGGQFLDLSDPDAVERLVAPVGSIESVEPPAGEASEELPTPEAEEPSAEEGAAPADAADDADREADANRPGGRIRGLIDDFLAPGAERNDE